MQASYGVSDYFPNVQGFFTKCRRYLVYLKYRTEAMRKADAVEISADKPTADL